jgi:hypothetical protein
MSPVHSGHVTEHTAGRRTIEADKVRFLSLKHHLLSQNRNRRSEIGVDR